ncbi:MAG: hypothetical protein AAGC96_06190 [Pseudomonadota bacterium]
MSDDFARPGRSTSQPEEPRGNSGLFALIAVLVVLLGGVVGWQWMQINALQGEVAKLERLVESAKTNDTMLSEIINANHKTLIERLNTISESVEQEIVFSAKGRMEQEVEDAIKRLSAFGNAGFVFQMEEFDRRSCVNGGLFSGETPDYNLVELPFTAGAMVQVQPTHTDINGIPFYRVTVDDTPIGDNPGEYRHGSMRIACN